MSGPALRPTGVLLSPAALQELGEGMAARFGDRPWRAVLADDRAFEQAEAIDLAVITREVTGRSTKLVPTPALQAFHDTLRAAPHLRWVQAHSAGADRAIYGELRARGVAVTTASGANAPAVAVSAVAGVLALARRFPQFSAAQRERRWDTSMVEALPPDLDGQTAVIVGWGPVARRIAELLEAFGVRCEIIRHSEEPAGAGRATYRYVDLPARARHADWLILACPLSPLTRNLVDASLLEVLPPHAYLINVARGEVVDEAALIEALASRRLAGAHLDVFVREPLPVESPLWSLDSVIVTPHAAGHSAGNRARVAGIFLDNLERWIAGRPLRNAVA
jgi:phosphoglycerate dehydrogenase-like enzyme